MWAFNSVALVYFFAAGISFLLSYLAWKMRPAKGAVYFSIMMMAVFIWVSAYVLELFNTTLYWKIILNKIGYTGMAIAVYAWFVFVATYTQYDSWLNKWILIILGIIPVFTLTNIFLSPSPNFLQSNYHLIEVNDLVVLAKTYMGGFYLWTAYAYSMLVGGMVLMVLRMLTMPKSQRKQIYLLAPMVLIIIIPNLVHILSFNPIYPYDPTPISLAIVGILFLISIYRHKLIDVMPVAHAQVIKNMRSAVIVVDARDRILEINPAAQTIFNIEEKDVVGKAVLDLLPECKAILKVGPEISEINTEISIDKLGLTFELRVNSLLDSKEHYTGRILLFFDITEKINAINELDAYARTVAHDLKNPLNIILGYAQLLSASCEDKGEEDCENLIGIKQGAMHMNDIIESLLLLAQVRNIKSVNSEQLDMKALLDSSIERLGTTVLESGAKINVNSEIISATGVGIWVEEVWGNLISNAIKYGGEKPRIEIDSYQKTNKVYYTIKDSGIGLSKEEQERVFVEFARMHRHKHEITGHGLGLSIVKRIITKLGGDVGVDSEQGVGSTFFFSLPLK